MNWELSKEDARFLSSQLERHTQEVESELIHTDNRALQSELAHDLERLRSLTRRLVALVTQADRAA